MMAAQADAAREATGTSGNGLRERRLETRVGTIALRIPKLRRGAYFPDGPAEVFHAGTRAEDGRYYTNGGRVLGVTATGDTLAQAVERAYAAADEISFESLHRRADIGARALAAGR